MVANNKKDIQSIILMIVIILCLFVGYFLKDKQLRDRDREYVINEYKLQNLDTKLKEYKIKEQKLILIQDSLEVLIKKIQNEKQKIKYKYIRERDSVISLPLDQSIDFFSRNLPKKDSH